MREGQKHKKESNEKNRLAHICKIASEDTRKKMKEIKNQEVHLWQN